jgi:hypothetical protein
MHYVTYMTSSGGNERGEIAASKCSNATLHECVVSETCMNLCLAERIIPCLAPLFLLLGGVYRAVAWQWTPGTDSTIAAFRHHITIYWEEQMNSAH